MVAVPPLSVTITLIFTQSLKKRRDFKWFDFESPSLFKSKIPLCEERDLEPAPNSFRG
jgi:hypothetical protein